MSPFDRTLTEWEETAQRADGDGDIEPRVGPGLPAYLRDTYAWAYLWPASIRLLDRHPIVTAILWGNYARLQRAALAEIASGDRVLQPACVYGDLSQNLAGTVGPAGLLEVCDVAPQQVENCRRKLGAAGNVRFRLVDAADHAGGGFDAVCCFFLLHELPDDHKRRVTDSLLAAVRPGGRVVFVDYRMPAWWHPLKPVMSLVFDWLEPFAKGLWTSEISAFASAPAAFDWSKQSYFGGMYQKTVAVRRSR